MKKVLLAIAALMTGLAINAQNVFYEDFENAALDSSNSNGFVFFLPEGWSCFKLDNAGNRSNINYFTDAWRVVNFTSGKALGCITYAATDGQAVDRWVVTPAITIEDGNVLEFLIGGSGNVAPDILSIYAAGPNASTSEDFLGEDGVCLLDHQSFGQQGVSDYHYFSTSLSALEGQTVRLAFRATSVDEWILRIDEVRVYTPAANEVALTGINIANMAAINSNVTVGGTFSNNGSDPLTTLTVSYTVDGGEPVTETLTNLNVPMRGTGSFTFSTPINLSTEGNHTVVVTLSEPNGVADNTADNTLSATFLAYDAANVSPRTVLFEEFTTSNCGNCPGAHVRIHNALATRNNVIVVCHHDGYYTDAMTVQESSELTWFYNAGGATYAPASMLDRRHFDFSDNAGPVFLPGNDVGACMDEALAVPAFASIEISNVNFDPATRQLTATVSGSLNTDLANPRLSVYLVQDSIVEAQSGAAYNPAQQVGSKYRHMDVMRGSLLEGTWGKPIARGAFCEQISYTMPAKIKTIELKPWRCRLVAFVSNFDASNAGNCAVENATESANINAPFVGIDGAAQVEMALYPNPATDYVVLQSNDDMQEVSILNTLGQVVYTSQMNGRELMVNTRDFAAGLYIATVRTANGTTTQRFSVVK